MVSDTPQAQLDQYVQQQAWLLKVTRQIASSVGLSETIPHVLSGVDHALKADCARLLLAGPREGAWQAFGMGDLSDAAATADSHLASLVSTHGGFEYTRGGDEPGGADMSFVPAELASLIALPLAAQNRQQGVLWLGYRTAHQFADGERTFLAILAGQAAIAIANSRSFEAARKRREWLAAVLTSTPDPVLVVDRDRRLQLANPAAQETFAALTDKEIGLPLDQLNGLAALPELFGDGAETDRPESIEFKAQNGRTYSPRVSDVRTENGEMTGWVLVLRDITHFKRLNDNMSEFLSTVSHDMRSPLTFMKGYLDMLNMVGELNEKQAGFVDKIAVGVIQMSDMVEKILDAAKLDPVTGTYTLSREACDLAELVEKIELSLAEPAKRSHLDISYKIDPSVPILNLDRAMVSSAYTNLVENAIKYTPEGGAVEAELSVDPDTNSVVFRVADNGYGISEEDQQKLFQRNMRVRRKEWKRIKGSGLGLFIVKNVAQRHGGDAWVESAVDEGSTFYLSLPIDGPNLIGRDSSPA